LEDGFLLYNIRIVHFWWLPIAVPFLCFFITKGVNPIKMLVNKMKRNSIGNFLKIGIVPLSNFYDVSFRPPVWPNHLVFYGKRKSFILIFILTCQSYFIFILWPIQGKYLINKYFKIFYSVNLRQNLNGAIFCCSK
jgi:hypothetical protein